MKKIITILFIIMLMPTILAEPSFELKLVPHFYLDGAPVFIYSNSTPFDGISFEVIGKNLDKTSRIINLTIKDISPELLGYLQPTKQILLPNQEKTLWITNIILKENFNTTNFIEIGILGTNERINETFYNKAQYSLDLNNLQVKEGPLKNIGEWLWPGDYNKGLLIFYSLIILLIVIWWRQRISSKLERWRRK